MENKLTGEQIAFLEKDKSNGIKFKSFLSDINTKYESYFKSREDGKNSIEDFFILWTDKIPPAFCLIYTNYLSLDSIIKNEVVNKYKEIFGEYAIYSERDS